MAQEAEPPSGGGDGALEGIYHSFVEVFFSTAKGTLKQSVCEPNDEDASLRTASLVRRAALGHLGPEYSLFVSPAVPAPDLTQGDADYAETVPEALGKPLIKVSKDHPKVVLQGWASGCRSALVKAEGTWYRLKGCGNDDKGFLFSTLDDGMVPQITLRGSSFEHTTHRELYFSRVVSDLLKPSGRVCANSPVGWYEYQTPSSLLPKVKRCCSIFTTEGNRRLGSHLLLGIERLLPYIIDMAKYDPAAMRARFDKRRFEDPEQLPTWAATLFNNYTDEPYPLVDLRRSALPEQAPRAIYRLGSADPDPRDAGLEKLSPELTKLWARDHGQLTKALDGWRAAEKRGSVLGHAMWQLGVEAGELLGVLHRNNISWGTYNDMMGAHCNAHCNNYVILPEGHDSGCLLAPLDFDMAFHLERAIPDKMWEGATEGAYQKHTVAHERDSCRATLAGDPGAFLTGTPATAMDLHEDLVPLRWALRDTVIRGFNQAYATVVGGGDLNPYPYSRHPELTKAQHALFRMALTMTSALKA